MASCGGGGDARSDEDIIPLGLFCRFGKLLLFCWTELLKRADYFLLTFFLSQCFSYAPLLLKRFSDFFFLFLILEILQL